MLGDKQAKDMCLRFAALERKLGEIDRARAILVHASQFCDPRTEPEFWKVRPVFASLLVVSTVVSVWVHSNGPGLGSFIKRAQESLVQPQAVCAVYVFMCDVGSHPACRIWASKPRLHGCSKPMRCICMLWF